jgi:hypothetical protein
MAIQTSIQDCVTNSKHPDSDSLTIPFESARMWSHNGVTALIIYLVLRTLSLLLEVTL